MYVLQALYLYNESQLDFIQPWFDDGNIILVTQDTPTAFRLHRGVLVSITSPFYCTQPSMLYSQGIPTCFKICLKWDSQ